MTREDFIAGMDQLEKLVRIEYALTQDKMAVALGLSKKTLVEIEKGRRSLGWSSAVALGTVFSDSTVLQDHFGGEVTELVASIAFDGVSVRYPKTMGGRIWWTDVENTGDMRIQQNMISGHYRLLDGKNRRIISSFSLDIVRKRMKETVNESDNR